MALLRCPECGASVSDQAASCPQCGLPRQKPGSAPPASGTPRLNLTTADLAKSTIGRVVVGTALCWSGVAFEAPPVIVASLLVFGSAIPLWVKAWKAERRGEVPDPRALPRGLEQRLLDAEERELQRLEDLEQHADRIADLEERLEFTERLLAARPEERKGQQTPTPG